MIAKAHEILRVYDPDRPDASPLAVSAGPFVFTRGFHGSAAGKADITEQCERVYSDIAEALSLAGTSLDAGVRIDHFTQSQGWLAERQVVRAKHFGRPAPIASTGVAAGLAPDNLLTAAVIAAHAPDKKEVLISGADYGMAAVSTAVRAEEFVFIAGILADGGWWARNGSAPRGRSQAEGCWRTIKEILETCELSEHCVVRQDIYYDGESELQAFSDAFPSESNPNRAIALPFGANDRIEVTTLAHPNRAHLKLNDGGVAANAGGFLFFPGVTVPKADAATITDALSAQIAQADRSLSDIVRLDVVIDTPSLTDAIELSLMDLFGAAAPALIVIGGNNAGASAQAITI